MMSPDRFSQVIAQHSTGDDSSLCLYCDGPDTFTIVHETDEGRESRYIAEGVSALQALSVFAELRWKNLCTGSFEV